MHSKFATTALWLALGLVLAACSGTETRPSDITAFEAGDYRYYTWRSEPLANTSRSNDPLYKLDPLLRRAVDSELRAKGYELDPAKAQFSVDYFFAVGMREGQKSDASTNIRPYPTALPSRLPDGATVDNAYALGGVKETGNIALQFNDEGRREEVWHVIITWIVEDANMSDTTRLERNVQQAVRQGLRPLPAAD